MAKYDAIRAFARGMMEALLEKEDAPKQPRVNVVKTDDIEAAVKKYLDAAIYGGGEQPDPPADAHEPPPPPTMGVVPPEMETVIRETMGDLADVPEPRARFYRAPDPEAGTYDANMPGQAPWTTPPATE